VAEQIGLVGPPVTVVAGAAVLLLIVADLRRA
jgi:hypothetical protein